MKTVLNAAIAAALYLPAAHAIPVQLSGDTVDFFFDDVLLGLFGTPTLLGDSLYFTPTEFDVSSLNGAGFAFANSTVNIKVVPKAGFDLDGMSVTEKGDYLLLGSGPSGVDVSGQIRVFELSDPASLATTSLAPSAPLTVTGTPTTNWTALSTLGLDGPGWVEGEGINLTIENLLLAHTTSPVSLAFIEKKFVGVEVVTSPVPEPANLVLLLSSLGLIGFMVQHRKGRPDFA